MTEFDLLDTWERIWTDAGPTPSHYEILPLLLRMIRGLSTGKALSIVDLGCGNGYIAGQLSLNGHRVVGIDGSRRGLEIARRSHPGVVFHESSVYARNLPELVGGNNDCVTAIELIEHLFFPSRLFSQVHSILRSGGSLIVSTPYHGYLKNLCISLFGGWDGHFGASWEGGHIKFFSRRTLATMAAQAGFTGRAFEGVGRVPWLWKSMLMVFQK